MIANTCAYVLRMSPDGAWEVLSAVYKRPVATLESGSVALDDSQCHRLELSFSGSRVTATLDGKILAVIESTAHSHGSFGLGTELDNTQFDNLHVEPCEQQIKTHWVLPTRRYQK